MILPRGITGFRDVKDGPLPCVDFKEFKRVCHFVARVSEIELIHSEANSVDHNYYCILFAAQETEIMVLCNLHFPFVAFAKSLDNGETTHSFLDNQRLADEFETDGTFAVLTAEVLNSSFDGHSLTTLSAAEREQAKYWNPHRLGDLIFNNWD